MDVIPFTISISCKREAAMSNLFYFLVQATCINTLSTFFLKVVCLNQFLFLEK